MQDDKIAQGVCDGFGRLYPNNVMKNILCEIALRLKDLKFPLKRLMFI